MRRRHIMALVGALALLGSVMTPATAYPRPGLTERVSLASDGTDANDASGEGAISADGRYLAFTSAASNLVPGDTNGTWDVFVHDMQTGTTQRVSVASDGTEGNDHSLGPAISADGRHVAFESLATNLVPGDTNGTMDVFVHDLQTGSTERVSVASDGTEGNGRSRRPSISADGRHVAFDSLASNLVPDDTCCVFVHDRETRTTEPVPAPSFSAAISADGRHVAFDSFASNLVPDDTNGAQDVFVHDLQTGVTQRVSVASDGSEGNSGSRRPSISADGRYVAFDSLATNLVPSDTNDTLDVFVHDLQTGTTERVSVASDGTEGEMAESSFVIGSSVPAISADGRHVSFASDAPNLVPGDTNGTLDVFVHDLQTRVTERVSVAAHGAQGNGQSAAPSISVDGRHIAFQSIAGNLVPGDTNGSFDVFVRDRGSATGVGSLEAQSAGGELMVSGWATFSGAIVASAADPGDDGEVGGRELGAEIVGASITYRPEQEDLLMRIDLASLPGLAPGTCPPVGPCVSASTGAGAPGTLYRWSFTVGGSAYEVRALRAAATATPPAAPYFALYECAPTCTETAALSGGIGTTGAEVRASVPLKALGAEEGAVLTDVEGSAALGEASLGPVVVLDEVALPDASITVSRLELGVAPASTPVEEVTYTAEADLAEGAFSGTVDVSSLAAGEYRVWARACLGEVCGASSVDVSL